MVVLVFILGRQNAQAAKHWWNLLIHIKREKMVIILLSETIYFGLFGCLSKQVFKWCVLWTASKEKEPSCEGDSVYKTNNWGSPHVVESQRDNGCCWEWSRTSKLLPFFNIEVNVQKVGYASGYLLTCFHRANTLGSACTNSMNNTMIGTSFYILVLERLITQKNIYLSFLYWGEKFYLV